MEPPCKVKVARRVKPEEHIEEVSKHGWKKTSQIGKTILNSKEYLEIFILYYSEVICIYAGQNNYYNRIYLLISNFTYY